MAVELHVGLVGRTGLTHEIYRQLRAAILDGTLRPGDQLPPTRDLAARLNVARTTVTAVYERLAGEGYVSARTGSGTFVSGTPLGRPTSRERSSGPLRPRPRWLAVPLPPRPSTSAEFDFRTGVPDISLFPHDTWRRLVAKQLRAAAMDPARYGHPAGDRRLREAIARHVGAARAVSAVADDIVVTTGTQQAIDLVARVLLDEGDLVAVEEPGYAPPRLAFPTHGARVAGVPVDDEGIVVDAIPDATRLVYVTPSHQYPLGMTMSLARRIALLDWADAHDAAIIEDDYDSEFRFGGRPLEPLHALRTDGRVIYVGSFSKSMFPTLRLGFVVVPQSLRAATHAAKFVADWHSPLEPQRALAEFIDAGHFARHVRRTRAMYKARHERLVGVLAGEFADFDLIPSDVGLHVCVSAPGLTAESERAVWRSAREAGVAVGGLAALAVDHPPRAGFVFGYSAIPVDRIEEGLARFRRCLPA